MYDTGPQAPAIIAPVHTENGGSQSVGAPPFARQWRRALRTYQQDIDPSDKGDTVKRLLPDRRYTAPGLQKFISIGPLPLKGWNVQFEPYFGEPGWVRLECRSGERARNDPTSVNRVGLDGYTDLFPIKQRVNEQFSFVPGKNARAVKVGQWLNFHEIHATTLPGDIEQAGPLGFFLEWSSGLKRNVFRIVRNVPIRKGTAIVGKKPYILYQGDLTEGQRYNFAVDFYEHPTAGYVRIWQSNKQIVDYRGPFGYGGGRQNYPQFRIYRGQRTETAVTYTKITSIRTITP